MIRNYLLTIYKNIISQKLNSIVNVFGLATGIAAASLIFLFVYTEMSFDKSWNDYEKIYRIDESFNYYNKSNLPYALSSPKLAEEAKRIIPNSIICRVDPVSRRSYIMANDEWIDIGNICYADTTYFDMFSYPKTNFNCKRDTVYQKAWISRAKYNKYYKQLKDSVFTYDDEKFKIVGIFNKNGYHSHLSSDIVIVYSKKQLNYLKKIDDWSNLFVNTYIKSDLPESQINSLLEDSLGIKTDRFVKKRNLLMKIKFSTIPIKKIHFNKNIQYDSLSNINKTLIFTFSLIGFLILLMASINNVNMAIARGGKRAKEIAIRKTVGARKIDIILQFMGESIMQTLISIVVSCFFVELIFTSFLNITHYHMGMLDFSVLKFLLLFFVSVWVVIGFVSGIYPALILSQFKPLTIIKGAKDNTLYDNIRSYFISSTKIRKFMLVVQFSVSGAIVISTIIIQLQVNYILNRDIGFDINKLLVFEINQNNLNEKVFGNIINGIKAIKDVESVAYSTTLPGKRTWRSFVSINHDSTKYQSTVDVFDGSPNLLSTLGCKILKGRYFENIQSNKIREVIVNQSFVEELGISDPLGLKLILGRENSFIIVGIIKNFNYYSLHKKIIPLIIIPQTYNSSYLIVRTKNPEELVTSPDLIKVWNNYIPDLPPKINVLKNLYNSQYDKEITLLVIFKFISILSLIIACLGLFALSTFSIQKLNKEISIKKILGAGWTQIIVIIYKEFFQIIIISTVFSIVAAYLFSVAWIKGFATYADFGIVPYLIGCLFVFIIGFISIAYNVFKVLDDKATKYLKYE